MLGPIVDFLLQEGEVKAIFMLCIGVNPDQMLDVYRIAPKIKSR